MAGTAIFFWGAMQGLLGTKVGMTRIYDEDGRSVPVTIISCGPCTVLQHKTPERDGYEAVQLGYQVARESLLSRAEAGSCRKVEAPALRRRREVAVAAGSEVKPGSAVTVKIFEDVPYVDVTGVSKGKGFAGVVRRYGMSGGFKTHGSHSKRRPGSVGSCKPQRIHKGKRMPGQMGAVRITQQNLKVIRVRPEDNVLLVRGAVPGHAGALLLVKKSLKRGKAL